MALIWVTACVLVIAGIVFSGLTSMTAHERMAEVGFDVDGRAHSIARAGIVDALAWLRRQPAQPVTDFAPVLDLQAAVPKDETDNPSLGLVRTFEISPGLWGRYVVRRGRPMDPFTDQNGNGFYDVGEPFEDLDADDIWTGGTSYTYPTAFTVAAVPLVAAYRTELEALVASYGGVTTSESFLEAAEQLRASYEQQLTALAATHGVPESEAMKLLDAVVVDTTEESSGTGDGSWTDSMWTRDIGSERGEVGDGTLWRLESRGTVFRMSDATQPLGRGQNVILGSASLATEVRLLTVSPPANAAICAPHASYVTVGVKARIRAPGLGVGVEDPTGCLDMQGGVVVAPTPESVVPDYDGSVHGVFGVDWSQLRSMADVSASVAKQSLYRMIDPYTLVVLEGNATFGPKLPLLGKGILAVDGDLKIEAESNSYFTGLLYVSGDLVIEAPAHIQGTIICTGSVRLEGYGASVTDIQHDPNVVGDLMSVMGQYRISRAVYVPDVRLEGWSLTGETGYQGTDESPAPSDPWSNFWNDGGTSTDPGGGGEATEWWLDR